MSLVTATDPRPEGTIGARRPTIADLHVAVVTAYPDHGGLRWARLLADAGITGRESDPGVVVDQLITTMRASTDPIMARCGAVQQTR